MRRAPLSSSSVLRALGLLAAMATIAALLLVGARWLLAPGQAALALTPVALDGPTPLQRDALAQLLDPSAAPSPSRASSASGSSEPWSAADERRLRAQIARVLEEEGVPGVGVALIDRDGVRWTDGIGVAELETGAPVTPDTVFRVASITKSFIALALMQQVEAGRLSLDDELRALAPDLAFDNPWASEAPITVAHLLEHTTGWDDMRFNEFFAGPEAEDAPLVDVLAINPRSRRSRWRPGTRVSYSNPNYTVAAHVLERVTGERYEDTLRRDVLRPLGMQRAGFRRTPERDARLAAGYAAPGEPTPHWYLVHRPAGNLMASPRELARLVHMWIQRGETIPGGQLLTPESLARMERGETIPGVKSDADYGLGTFGYPRRPIVMRGHDGGLPGYISSYGYSARHGVGYVMLLNNSYSGRAYLRIRQLLVDALVEGRRLPPPPTVELPRAQLERYAGSYRFVSPRIELFGFLERAVLDLDVRVDERDHLQVALAGGDPIRLIPTGRDTFRVSGQAGSSVVLTTTPDGARTADLGLGYNFEAGNAALIKGGRWLLVIGWTLILAGFYSALLWVGKLLFGDEETRLPGYIPTRAAPVLAAAAIVAAIRVFVLGATRFALGEPNLYSIGFMLLTLAFAGLSGAALAHSIRAFTRYASLGLYTRLHSLSVSIACFGFTLWLLRHGVIGLRTWLW